MASTRLLGSLILVVELLSVSHISFRLAMTRQMNYASLPWKHYVFQVCGIGKVSQQMLSALDIMTCRDLYVKRGVLFHLYSTTSFHHFMQICAGIGSTRVERSVLC